MRLDPLFRARSVALIGLSGDPRKMTGAPLQILRQTGFPGSIYPVNPKYDEIDGLRAYPSVAALPAVPDVAMIMLPAAACAQAVRDCGAKGISACVIPSSGFEETEEGATHAAALKRAAADTGIALVGPNCEGLWSVRDRVLLTFGSAARRDVLHHAPVAILSQSGAIGGAVARHLQNDAVGCSYLVSVGNEAVLSIADYFEWMMDQDDARVVLMFIEGLRDGARLLGLIERAVRRGIRVAVLKSGNSAAGMKAAASHTGKIASSAVVYKDLLRQAGAVWVDSLTDLIAAGEVLACAPLPPVRGAHGGVAVFSIPGGTRAMTADHLELRDVPLSTFARETVQALTAALPEFGGVENPTDLTGQVLSHPGLFDTCLSAIAADPHSEALIVQVANRGPRDITERSELLGSLSRRTGLPVIATFLGDALPAAQRAALRAAGVLSARDPAEAALFLSWLYGARRAAARPEVRRPPPGAARALPQSWDDTLRWLRDAGIAAPGSRVLRAGEDAERACRGLRFPVAVKAMAQDADHKTELGLVSLNVATPAQVGREVDRIRGTLGRAAAPVLVQEMVSGGVEVLLGAMRDPDFGPVLAIGIGGIAVELFRDIAWVALPAAPGDIRDAVSRLKLAAVLKGLRGKPPADVNALADAASRFGAAFLATTPAAAEFEINPLLVLPAHQGVIAVDALVRS